MRCGSGGEVELCYIRENGGGGGGVGGGEVGDGGLDKRSKDSGCDKSRSMVIYFLSKSLQTDPCWKISMIKRPT